MMLVKTYVASSPIGGNGLFAAEFISKGTVVWKYVPGFDLRFTAKEIEAFPEAAKEFMKTYSYKSKDTGYYVLCGDHARFFNHSNQPNTRTGGMDGTEGEGIDIANRDIQSGEEMTCDYGAFDEKMEEKIRINIERSRA